MAKLIMPIGPSASGKSTAAAERYPGAAVVSFDAVRAQIDPRYEASGDYAKEYEAIFTRPAGQIEDPAIYEKAKAILGDGFDDGSCLNALIAGSKLLAEVVTTALKRGEDVIVDNMNTSPKTRRQWLDLADSVPGSKKVALLMLPTGDSDMSLAEILISNNELRISSGGRGTPEHVLENMAQLCHRYYGNYEEFSEDSEAFTHKYLSDACRFDAVEALPIKSYREA